jgi:hypothetical protein
MAENPPDAAQRAFRTAIGEALSRIDRGERGAERFSGVSRGTWSDTKKGKSVPKPPIWSKMRVLLRSDRVPAPEVDWDALYRAARAEKDRQLKRPGSTPAARPGRHYLSGLESIRSFALPVVDRLDLVREAVPDWEAGTGRIIIAIGEGGLGKSLLLKQAAESLTAPRRPNGGAVVAVACSRIESAETLTDVQGADAAFARAAGVPVPRSGIVRALERLREQHGSVHLLIDTLDVVATEHTARALRELLRRCAEHARIFATCRKREHQELFVPNPGSPWHDGEPPELITMPDLSEDQIVEWADRYVSTLDLPLPQREDFIASLSDPARARTIKRICAVPLRLAMACRLYSDQGRLPADLTITGLYEEYWEQRIARDRHNMMTTLAQEQVSAALALAERVLKENSDRLTLDVELKGRRWNAAIKALVSDGVVLDKGGRYGFFHQTYAEFAIAVLLAQRAEDERLRLLHSDLGNSTSHLWPTALHMMLLQKTSPGRHAALVASVPIDTSLGSQYHLLAASTRGLPQRLETVAARITERDGTLMQSLAGLLADAHPDCTATALDICIPLLGSGEQRHLVEISRAIGSLLRRLPPEPQRIRLTEALDLAEQRRAELGNDAWVNLPFYLIEHLCQASADTALFDLLCARYGRLGPLGQREVLRTALANRAKLPELIAKLSEPVLSASPPNIDHAEGVALLRWCMDDPGVREKRGWGDWSVLLKAGLPSPWDAMQIRFVGELCGDEAIRDDLLARVLSDRQVELPERWTNTAKFVADDFPVEVAAALGRLPEDASRNVVGKALALAKQISRSLPKEERLRFIEAFTPHASTDPRQVWTALIQLAHQDVDLHEALLDVFYETDRRMWPPRDGQHRDWAAVRLSPIGSWLRTAPVEFLDRQRARFRTMLPAEGDELVRRAGFEGRIAHLNQSAHDWLTDQILTGASASAALRGLESMVGETGRSGPTPTAEAAAWRCRLLRTPHTGVATVLANLLADPDATPTPLLESDEVVTDGSGSGSEPAPLLDLVASAALDRLHTALGAAEHTNLVKALLSLVFRIDDLQPLDHDLVKELLRGTAAPVTRLKAEVEGGSSASAASELATSFARWSATVRKIGLTRLPVTDVIPTVESVLTGWDCERLGTDNRRKTASLIRSVMDRSPEFASWVEERLWPNASPGTRLAIAEAALIHERYRPGDLALRLSQRQDCPHDVRIFIHEERQMQS